MRFWKPVLPCLLALLSWATVGVADPLSTTVRYISAEHIYVEAGASQGLRVGLTGEVKRDGKTVAVLEIVFVADHSASCRILGESIALVVGDEVDFALGSPASGTPVGGDSPGVESRVRAVPPKVVETRTEAEKRELRGTIGLQWDHTADRDRNLQTDYWALPFRFKVTGLGHGWTLGSRGTFRHFERSGYSGLTPPSEWRNRILELSIARKRPDDSWLFAMGRVRSRAASAAGPFDGIQMEHRVGNGSYLGLFGGFTPEWGTYAFGTEDHVAGATWRFRRMTDMGKFLDCNIAALGRYRGGEISREFLTWSVSWRNGPKLNIIQAGEVDLNRGWRGDLQDAGRVSLTSLALTGRLKVSRNLDVDLGFDDRDLVRTYESRSLPDSLFQDSGRKGLRAGWTLRRRSGARLSFSGSLRRDESQDADVTSWMGRFMHPRLGGRSLGIHCSIRGFDGPYLKGWAPQVGTSFIRGNHRFGLDAGGYYYQGQAGSDDRANSWAKIRWTHDLTRAWSATAEYQKDWGDDIAGNRWWVELRHRF